MLFSAIIIVFFEGVAFTFFTKKVVENWCFVTDKVQCWTSSFSIPPLINEIWQYWAKEMHTNYAQTIDKIVLRSFHDHLTEKKTENVAIMPTHVCARTRLCPHDYAHTRLCPDTIVPRHVCAQTRLCPHDYAHTRLCPDTIVPTHVCARTRLCPHTFVSTHVCAHTRLCPHMFVPRHICVLTCYNRVVTIVSGQKRVRLCPDTYLVPWHAVIKKRNIAVGMLLVIAEQ